MDLHPAPTPRDRRPLSATALRVGWLAILTSEVGILIGCFGPRDYAGLERWRARFDGWSWVVTRPALVVATATLLIGIGLIRSAPGRGGRIGHARRVRYASLAHVIAFTGLALLTGILRDDGAAPSPRSGIWAVAWAASGLSALAFWSVAVFPNGAAGTLAWYGSVALAAGSAAGVVAAAIGRISTEFWHPLSRSTLWVVHRLLSLAYPDPVYLPADLIVGTESFPVRVEAECSGYEGIGLILTFLAAYLWFGRGDYRFPRSFLLLPLGALAMWLANAIRLALLVSVGTSVSPDVAERGFHSHAGWLALVGVGLGLVFATRRMRFFTGDGLATARSEAPNRTAAYLAPLAAILAISLLTGAFTVGFDGLYPGRVLAASVVLWAFRGDYAGVRRTWSWPAVAIGGFAFLPWMALERATIAGDAGATLAAGLAALSPAGAAAWLAFRVAGSVVTVPLAEELAFRGYLTRRLIADDFEGVRPGRFTWSSFLVSSALFGALHGRWVAGTLAGMLYASALYRRGELADAVLAHATTNALIAVYVLAKASWSLWA